MSETKAEQKFKFKLLDLQSVIDPDADLGDKDEARNLLTGIENSIKDIVEDSTEKEEALLKDSCYVDLNMLDFDESKGSKKLSR